MSNNTQSSAPSRCGRPQTISYADLMKPDEDWRNLPDASERRKIQNRLAQRAYRRNMRDRTKEVERLKQQLQKLQEAQDSNAPETTSTRSSTTSASEPDTSASGSSTPSRQDSTFSVEISSPPPTITGSDWMGSCFQVWSQSPSQDDDLHGLGLTTDGEQPMNFDSSSYFPQLSGPEDYFSSPPAAARSRAVSTSNVTSPPLQHHHQHMRSNSNPPFFSRCDSPSANSSWPHNHRSDSRDSLQVPGMSASPSPLLLDPLSNQNGLLALSPASFNLYPTPDELTLPIPDPSFSLDDLTPTAAYPTPPESNLGGAWPALNGKSQQRDRSPSTATTTSAPLLHLAVESGNMDTLRLLLQRFDISINAKDGTGCTALQKAVMLGRADMVSVLLEHGADISGNDAFAFRLAGEAMSLDGN
ncbi:hypothetical protein BKA67DRAFT_660301 [Truncatella angustata]|uniref:BZIP domain-containing protein n=1 Tax=Truncatella angustata TaxID=152316 RepID=A0A9P8UG44_9PEZI|nr:uncharacterized protein BKA67DRAFT_660301 [Truncatella angustata]KAH6651493.1 hypothetical protein BKA67DRAFT_660301 [Truncatella angustata]KAH8203788.1 hypothetical protein TruAng_002081 [Truncatella angustata]